MASVLEISEVPVRDRTVDEMVELIERAIPKLQAHALAEEKAGRLSAETVRTLDEIGVFRISTPLEYGGLAFSTEDQRRVYAACGMIAGSTGWVSWVTTTHGRWIAMFPKQAQDEIYGTEWVGPRISGVLSPHGPGKARRVDGGYMISGRWPFCSGCRHTAWTVIGSMTEGADGEPDMLLPLVRTADLEILDDWAVSGMKATGSNTVQLTEELFVPEHRVMRIKDASNGDWASPPPAGQPLYRNNFLDYTTILSGSTPLGMAKGALAYFKERLDIRGIVGTDYKVQAEAPVVHFQLAEASAKIDAAERLLSEGCRDLDRRAAAGIASDDLFQTKLKFDVAFSVRACCEAVEILHRGSGASTIHEANPMQRYARDSRVATVHAHFNYETCAENYGRALAGRPLFGHFSALEKKGQLTVARAFGGGPGVTREPPSRPTGSHSQAGPAAARRQLPGHDQARKRSRVRDTRGLRKAVAKPLVRSIERISGGQPLPAHLRGAVIALGNFDGFHFGHQAVVARAIEMARQRGVAAIVGTFDPHPVRHFMPDSLPFRLSTLDQRQRLLAEAGVDAMMVFEFDGALASVTPEQFVSEWLGDVGGVVTGDKFTFGRKRAGNVGMLAALCGEQGIECAAVRPVAIHREMVSSSRVRAALKAGDCAEAARLLTRPFSLEGTLCKGKRADLALSLLDASLELGDYLRPRNGVYAIRAKLADGRVLGGSAFMAPSPSAPLELFLVDLRESDLGKHVNVDIIAHLHDASETYDRPALRRRIVLDGLEGRELAFGAISQLLET